MRADDDCLTIFDIGLKAIQPVRARVRETRQIQWANALENNLVLFKYEKGNRSSVKWIRKTPTPSGNGRI